MSIAIKQDDAGREFGLAPLAKTRKAEAAYHAVRRSIVLGRIRPGDALREQKVAQQLGCSQGTVREAFLKLEHDGLVDRQGYGGTIVSATSVGEAAEMVKMRIQIECAGTDRCVRSLAPEALDTLDSITRQMDQATAASDYYQCSELDREFHLYLFRQSGLTLLEPILMRCQLHIHRFTYNEADDKKSDPDLGDNHRLLLGDLKTGDPETASLAICAHIETVLDRWAPELKEPKER
ncbi:MAG: GntR family transcriptional regulator [Methyloligellaceae bacterium]